MNKNFYQVGGALPVNSPSYVKRDADDELYNYLIERKYCYVLKYRQVGKSSLRVHCSQRLKLKGFKCINIDLTAFGSNDITAEKWYFSFLYSIVRQLNLSEDNFIDYWDSNEKVTITNRFALLIDQFILKNCKEKIVIFVDEIDSVLGIENFSTDDFFALIRTFYNLRSEDSRYNRLTFVLLGVASADDLMKDSSRTPFNIAFNVTMGQLKLEESYQLIDGLANQTINKKKILKKIFEYTSGTSYLTQKILDYVAKNPINSLEDIDTIVDNLFIQESFNEANIKNIQNRILNNETHTIRMLYLIVRILSEPDVKEVSSSKTLMYLKLSGLIKVENKKLIYSNLIYKIIFNRFWVDEIINTIERPIAKGLQNWIEHNKENIYLLKDEELINVKMWAINRNDVSAIEHEYLGLCIHEEEKKKSKKKFQTIGFIFIIILLMVTVTSIAFYIKLNESELKNKESIKAKERQLKSRLNEVNSEIKLKILSPYKYYYIPKSVSDENVSLEKEEFSFLSQNILEKNKALIRLITSSIRMTESSKKYWLANIKSMSQDTKEKLFKILQYYAYFDRAKNYNEQSEYNKAIEFYNEAKKNNPTNIDTYNELGDTYAQIEDYNKSIACYKQIIKIDPKNDKAYYDMGNIFLDLEQFSESLDSYENAVKINLQNDRAYVKMANIYQINKENEKALKFNNKALEINPSNHKARRAKESIVKLLEKQTIKKEDYYTKALFYMKQNRYEKAINLFNKLTNRNYQVYEYIGLSYSKLEKYDLSIKNYKNSIDKNSTNPNVYELMGNTYYMLTKYEKSVESYNKSIELKNKNMDIYANLHSAYINIFHKQLIHYNKIVNKELENEYIKTFKEDMNYFAYYKALKILEKTYSLKRRDKNIEYNWLKRYKKVILDESDLDYLRREWLEKNLRDRGEKIRFSLVKVLDVFKEASPLKLKYLNFSQAMSEAKQEKKIVLVLVMERGCQYCKKLEKEFEKKEIQKLLYKYFKVVKVDEKHIPMNEIVEDTPSLLFYESLEKQLFEKVSGTENITDLLQILKEEIHDARVKGYLEQVIKYKNKRVKYTRDGWVYLGEYRDAKWKTQKFEFNENLNPSEVQGSYLTAKSRQNIRVKLKGRIISGLKKDDDVKVIDIEINKKFYVWAKVKY